MAPFTVVQQERKKVIYQAFTRNLLAADPEHLSSLIMQRCAFLWFILAKINMQRGNKLKAEVNECFSTVTRHLVFVQFFLTSDVTWLKKTNRQQSFARRKVGKANNCVTTNGFIFASRFRACARVLRWRAISKVL